MDQDDGEASIPSRGRSELTEEEQNSVTVQAELSSVLEESVESLSAAVGGWRSELARSSERSSRLEATIASLSAAMETWKTDMSRTSARAEERLLRALEILESRMAQNQAIASEIRESMGASAAWLTRAMEEWKAEIRYGSGLTEVRLLSAIESLEGRVGQAQEAQNQTREHLENTTAEMGKNLEARLLTVKAVQDETREWLEAAATAMGNDAQSALGRLRELGNSVDAFRGEMRQNSADAHALASESHALLVGRLNEVVSGLSEVQSASAKEGVEVRGEVRSVKESVSEALATLPSAIAGGLAEMHTEVGSLKKSLSETLTTGLAESRTTGAKTKEELEASINSLKGAVDEWKGAVGTSAAKTETKLLRALEALEQGISNAAGVGPEIRSQMTESMSTLSAGVAETQKVVSETQKALGETQKAVGEVQKAAVDAQNAAVDAQKAVEKSSADVLGTLEGRMSLISAAGIESRDKIEGLVAKLEGSVQEWRGDVGTAANNTEVKLVHALEALQLGIIEGLTGRQEIENSVLARLEDLEERISRTQIEGEERQDRLESSVIALTQSIDDWRNKGRESAGRTKEKISKSLEALENRILETHEDESDRQNRMRKELAALTEAVEDLRSGGGDTTTVMRGLEELDEGLLRNRDDLANLADTFEAQFEIFEGRVGDAVAARIEELERNILERNKALVTLILGPNADEQALASLEGPPRRRPAEPTTESRAAQQRRRR